MRLFCAKMTVRMIVLSRLFVGEPRFRPRDADGPHGRRAGCRAAAARRRCADLRGGVAPDRDRRARAGDDRARPAARVRASYAASSALARQIENGAPADLFISADLEWMDYLAERRLIRPASRVNLLGNRLVLIAPTDRPVTLKIAPGFPLAAALGRERLALADPASVPAGKYAQRGA